MTQPKQQVFEGVRVIDLVSREAGAAISFTGWLHFPTS